MFSVEKIRALAAAGKTRKQAANEIGASYATVVQIAVRHGIRFRHGNVGQQRAPVDSRVAAMAALYRNGFTLQQVGDQFGLTRERVRQILTRRLGLTAKDGGQSLRAKEAARKRAVVQDAKYLRKYGCTWEQYREIRDYGQRRYAETGRRAKSPLYAFHFQKHSANTRGIGWELSLWQWWTIWKLSGQWDNRGRGQGYVMCRRGDVGPYSVENVFIDRATKNSSEKPTKTSGLPTGVRKNKKYRGYSAARMINGVTYRLGSFPTPELAYAAYLAAGNMRSLP